MEIEREVAKEKKTATLEDWYIDQHDQLVGKVYGHPKIADGTKIITGRVVSFNPVTGKAVTKNTNYTLGKRATL